MQKVVGEDRFKRQIYMEVIVSSINIAILSSCLSVE